MISPVSRSSELETRSIRAATVDLNDKNEIVGYAIVFNVLSEDLGGFRERIRPEAVQRSLNADIRALVDHDTSKVLGRTRAGTLALRTDQKGLRVTIEPDPEISYARDILRSVARRDVSGMSYRFRAIEEDWTEGGKGQLPIRDVIDMEFDEVSVVTFPAYAQTDVSVAKRSLERFQQSRQPAWDWRSRWHDIQTGDL